MVHLSPIFQAFSALTQAASQQTPSGELVVRQSGTTVPISSLPSQCQAGCQVLQTIVNCNNSPSCICTSSMGSELVSCINCLEAAAPNDPNIASEGQTLITDFNQLCGVDLTLSSPPGGSSSPGSGSGSGSGTSPGTNPGTGSGTGSGSGTSSGTGSGPAIGPKLGGAVSLKTAGMGICVAAAAIGAYIAL